MEKKKIAVLASLVLVFVVIGLIVVLNLKGSGSTSTIKTESDMKKAFKKIYSDLKDDLPSLETSSINVNDKDMVKAFTGLSSNDDIEVLVVSEPLMNAQAYSALMVKVKDGKNVEKVKQEMLDNMDMRKWVCVGASKLYITNNGNVIFAIMSSDDWAKPVYDGFKKYVNNDIGKELEKTGEDDVELPPEMKVE